MLTQLRHAVKPCEDDFPPLSPINKGTTFHPLDESQGLLSPTFCNFPSTDISSSQDKRLIDQP
jgi:hypothetical protein